jgi:membrane protein YqaA with SNARE-associated domain
MEAWLSAQVAAFLAWVSLPEVGLPSLFVVAAVSATLLPLGSEPALLGYVKLVPDMFWPAILVATLGNTVGGGLSYWIGRGAFEGIKAWKIRHPKNKPGEPVPPVPARAPEGGRWHEKAVGMLKRFGPRALLMSWLPGIGDPLCAVAGYLRFAFWPSIIYMSIGKMVRYIVLTSALLWLWPSAL